MRRLPPLLLALCLSACAHGSGQAELPDFWAHARALPRDSASATRFEPERLSGRVVLVTFIATWCFPCLTELTTLAKLERDLGAQGFTNVLVGMDLEGRRVLQPFAEQYAIRYPLVIADDAVRAGQTPFGPVRELPARVLFGRDGRVVGAYVGVLPYEQLAASVQRELDRHP